MATPPAGMEDRRGFDPRNYFKENRRAILVGASAAVMWFSGTLGSVVKIGLWIGVGLVVMMLVQQEDMLYANRSVFRATVSAAVHSVSRLLPPRRSWWSP